MSDILLPMGDHRKVWGLQISKEFMMDAGPFTGGSPKLVWHTTQGSSMAGALATVQEEHEAPHVVIDPASGKVVQTIPLNRAARALKHILPQATNTANCLQVEIVGFAEKSGSWSDEEYSRLAALAVLLEHRKPIPRERAGGVSFSHPKRLSGSGFVMAAGHCGHCHVPGNDHTDPGTGFRIGKLFTLMEKFD